MAKKEIWKPIEDLVGYEVSDKGNIRSWRKRGRGKSLSKTPHLIPLCQTTRSDYWYFKVTNGQRSVHREVAKAFLTNPNDLPEVNHLDEDKSNNSVENLCWCSRRENNVHSFGKTVKVYNPDGVLLEFDSISALAKAMDSNIGNVSRFVRGLRYRNGYKSWRVNFG